MISKIIRILAFLSIAIQSPLKYWRVMWEATRPNPIKKFTRKTYLIEVYRNCSKEQQLTYELFIRAKGIENVPSFPGIEHSKSIVELNQVKQAFDCDERFRSVKDLLPAFNVADENNDPDEMLSFLNSPIVKVLSNGTKTFSLN